MGKYKASNKYPITPGRFEIAGLNNGIEAYAILSKHRTIAWVSATVNDAKLCVNATASITPEDTANAEAFASVPDFLALIEFVAGHREQPKEGAAGERTPKALRHSYNGMIFAARNILTNQGSLLPVKEEDCLKCEASDSKVPMYTELDALHGKKPKTKSALKAHNKAMNKVTPGAPPFGPTPVPFPPWNIVPPYTAQRSHRAFKLRNDVVTGGPSPVITAGPTKKMARKLFRNNYVWSFSEKKFIRIFNKEDGPTGSKSPQDEVKVGGSSLSDIFRSVVAPPPGKQD